MTRGSMWTPEAQDKALARMEVRARLCACGCGQKSADTQREPDETPSPINVHTKVCTARAAMDAVRRAASSDKSDTQAEVKPSDGLLVWVTKPEEAT